MHPPSPVVVVGFDWTSFSHLQISSPECSIGFKSGLRAGHGKTYVALLKKVTCGSGRMNTRIVMLESVVP